MKKLDEDLVRSWTSTFGNANESFSTSYPNNFEDFENSSRKGLYENILLSRRHMCGNSAEYMVIRNLHDKDSLIESGNDRIASSDLDSYFPEKDKSIENYASSLRNMDSGVNVLHNDRTSVEMFGKNMNVSCEDNDIDSDHEITKEYVAQPHVKKTNESNGDLSIEYVENLGVNVISATNDRNEPINSDMNNALNVSTFELKFTETNIPNFSGNESEEAKEKRSDIDRNREISVEEEYLHGDSYVPSVFQPDMQEKRLYEDDGSKEQSEIVALMKDCHEMFSEINLEDVEFSGNLEELEKQIECFNGENMKNNLLIEIPHQEGDINRNESIVSAANGLHESSLNENVNSTQTNESLTRQERLGAEVNEFNEILNNDNINNFKVPYVCAQQDENEIVSSLSNESRGENLWKNSYESLVDETFSDVSSDNADKGPRNIKCSFEDLSDEPYKGNSCKDLHCHTDKDKDTEENRSNGVFDDTNEMSSTLEMTKAIIDNSLESNGNPNQDEVDETLIAISCGTIFSQNNEIDDEKSQNDSDDFEEHETEDEYVINENDKIELFTLDENNDEDSNDGLNKIRHDEYKTTTVGFINTEIVHDRNCMENDDENEPYQNANKEIEFVTAGDGSFQAINEVRNEKDDNPCGDGNDEILFRNEMNFQTNEEIQSPSEIGDEDDTERIQCNANHTEGEMGLSVVDKSFDDAFPCLNKVLNEENQIGDATGKINIEDILFLNKTISPDMIFQRTIQAQMPMDAVSNKHSQNDEPNSNETSRHSMEYNGNMLDGNSSDEEIKAILKSTTTDGEHSQTLSSADTVEEEMNVNVEQANETLNEAQNEGNENTEKRLNRFQIDGDSNLTFGFQGNLSTEGAKGSHNLNAYSDEANKNAKDNLLNDNSKYDSLQNVERRNVSRSLKPIDKENTFFDEVEEIQNGKGNSSGNLCKNNLISDGKENDKAAQDAIEKMMEDEVLLTLNNNGWDGIKLCENENLFSQEFPRKLTTLYDVETASDDSEIINESIIHAERACSLQSGLANKCPSSDENKHKNATRKMVDDEQNLSNARHGHLFSKEKEAFYRNSNDNYSDLLSFEKDESLLKGSSSTANRFHDKILYSENPCKPYKGKYENDMELVCVSQPIESVHKMAKATRENTSSEFVMSSICNPVSCSYDKETWAVGDRLNKHLNKCKISLLPYSNSHPRTLTSDCQGRNGNDFKKYHSPSRSYEKFDEIIHSSRNFENLESDHWNIYQSQGDNGMKKLTNSFELNEEGNKKSTLIGEFQHLSGKTTSSTDRIMDRNRNNGGVLFGCDKQLALKPKSQMKPFKTWEKSKFDRLNSNLCHIDSNQKENSTQDRYFRHLTKSEMVLIDQTPYEKRSAHKSVPSRKLQFLETKCGTHSSYKTYSNIGRKWYFINDCCATFNNQMVKSDKCQQWNILRKVNFKWNCRNDFPKHFCKWNNNCHDRCKRFQPWITKTCCLCKTDEIQKEMTKPQFTNFQRNRFTILNNSIGVNDLKTRYHLVTETNSQTNSSEESAIFCGPSISKFIREDDVGYDLRSQCRIYCRGKIIYDPLDQ